MKEGIVAIAMSAAIVAAIVITRSALPLWGLVFIPIAIESIRK